MFIRRLNGVGRIVMAGIMALLLLLLEGSRFLPETKWLLEHMQERLCASWWVEPQGLGATVCQTKKVKVNLPRWYLRLQAIRGSWPRGQRRACLLRWACYGLALSGAGWVWLLRWLMVQMMRAERVSLWQGNWGWGGYLSNQSRAIEVQVQLKVTADGVEEYS